MFGRTVPPSQPAPAGRAALLLTLSLVAAVAAGCCGDPTATTTGRRQFVEAFNASPSGCTLAGGGPEVTRATLRCDALPLARLKTRLADSCARYQGVGFEEVKLAGSDGEAVCDLTETCACP